MQFVDDYELGRRQVSSIAFLSEENGEAFWRGDEKLGRMLAKFRSLVRRRVPGTEVNANLLLQGHAHNRCAQILLDVVGESTQRRDVNAAYAGWQLVGVDLTKEGIENAEKAGQGFSATGRGRQQDGFAIQYCRHTEQLGVREIRISRMKPIPQARVQSLSERFGSFRCRFRPIRGDCHVGRQRIFLSLSN